MDGSLGRGLSVRPRLWLRRFRVGPFDPDSLTVEERLWCAALPEAVRGRYGATRPLVRRLLAPLLGCEPLAVPLHSPPGQPPRLDGGRGWISLSHSGDHLLLGWSPQPIGVDLEAALRPLQARALVDRFFPPQERGQLRGLAEEELRRAVLESWVHKEAAIKWAGGSLAADLRHWCWDHRGRVLVDLRRRPVPASRCELRGDWLCAAVGESVHTADWG